MTLTDGQIDGLSMAYNSFREAYYRFLDPCLAGKYLYLPDPLEKVATPAKRAPKVIQMFCASLSELQSTVVV